ncbi:MAG: hypothetical protein PHV20_02840 [Bacteroidales bacterium]|nr:hypothetical protein [Bacteroidales bacterium]
MKPIAALTIIVLSIIAMSCSKEPDITTGATKKSAYTQTQATDSITPLN